MVFIGSVLNILSLCKAAEGTDVAPSLTDDKAADVSDEGFGIKKVVKTKFEIYAVLILPEGEKDYDILLRSGMQMESRYKIAIGTILYV